MSGEATAIVKIMLGAWSAADWQAFAYVVLAGAAVVAGFWSLFNYRAARRTRAAEWMSGLFHDFYLDDRFKPLKRELEYQFLSDMGPLLEQRIFDRHVPLSSSEIELLGDLDTLLNYFEMLLYLEEQHRISGPDREMLFEYWFEVLCDRDHAALRRYVAHFGFERVARQLRVADVDRVMLYGSLMRYSGEQEQLGLTSRLSYEGPCLIAGRLFDLGEYPGLIADGSDQSPVAGELYTALDAGAIRMLDEFERFDASDRRGSLYQRRYLQLLGPVVGNRHVDAWVYAYNQELEGAPEITSGEWVQHHSARAANEDGNEQAV